MGFWRDLGEYLRELVWGDTISKVLSGLSLAALVFGSIFVGQWGLSIFLGISMISSFRLWIDRREVSDREDRLFRMVAEHLRGQIDTQLNSEYRMFNFAKDKGDDSYNAAEFRKHFPPIVATIEQWCAIPGAKKACRREADAWVLDHMPASIPDELKATLANAIVNELAMAINWNSAPRGRFAATPDENRHLSIDEGSGQWALYDNVVRVDDVDQAVSDLNALTMTAWNSGIVQAWRELARLDGVRREEIRDALTKVINGNRMSRKNCDRGCYEAPA